MDDQLLLSVIESIKSVKGQYPGKKELQKTVYLLQNKGLASNYSYRFYFYGPYSDVLDEDIQRLTIQGALEIHQDDLTHRIMISNHARVRAIADDSKNARLIRETINDLGQISPRHLELMTTIIFLLDNHMVGSNCVEGDLVAKVHDVKDDKYRDEEIRQYYRLLKEKEYIH